MINVVHEWILQPQRLAKMIKWLQTYVLYLKSYYITLITAQLVPIIAAFIIDEVPIPPIIKHAPQRDHANIPSCLQLKANLQSLVILINIYSMVHNMKTIRIFKIFQRKLLILSFSIRFNGIEIITYSMDYIYGILWLVNSRPAYRSLVLIRELILEINIQTAHLVQNYSLNVPDYLLCFMNQCCTQWKIAIGDFRRLGNRLIVSLF